MRKFIKSTVAVAGAVAMAFTMMASVPTVAKASDLSKSKAVYDPSIMNKKEVHYTMAGGSTPTAWNPLAESNTMEKTAIDGVYAMKITMPAYVKADEWKNRFKICKIDNTVLSDGWDHSIVLGTDLCGDNKTQFRIENAEEGTFTVYYEPTTGAVVIKDSAGADVDYTISWVGNEKDSPIIKNNDNDFVTLAVAEASALTDWEADKVPTGITEIPKFTAINKTLADKITAFDPSAMTEGETHYTMAGGSTPVAWNPIGRNNEMKATGISDIYSMEITMPAYTKADEWKNRFKICKIDKTVLSDGWDHSIVLGTNLCGDNKTQFRIENAEAGTFTVYYKASTGAVVIKDATGANVDYTISWVGNEKDSPIIKNNDNDFVTLAVAEASALTDWEADKIPTGVTEIPKFTTINKALDDEIVAFDPSTMAEGEVHYTMAGGSTPVAWNPIGRNNEMKATGINDIYSMEITMPAYTKADEWKNRFKICKIDKTVLSDGWDHSIVLGTNLCGDNKTQFRIENAEAGTFTVYYKASTGAVVIKDATGANVDYTISWVGNEKDSPIIKNNDNDFVTLAVAEASALTDWEADKVPAGITEIPKFTAINKALDDEIVAFDPSTMAEGEVHYTMAGGSTPVAWNPLGRNNELKETRYKGVYSMEITMPAYTKADEWKNRFKICKIDKTVLSDGWDHSIVLGTTLCGDSKTQFRIENTEEGTFTVYYDTTTGAVVIKDANGDNVDYTISWVGNEKDSPIIKNNDNDFVTLAVAEASALTDWEADKIPTGVTEIPKFSENNAALAAKLAVVPAEKEEVDPEPVKAALSIKATTRTIYTGKAGNTVAITAKVVGASKKVTWKSSKTSVATVSTSGKVTAKKAGTAKISATANGITKTITITVKNPKITVKSGNKSVSAVSVKAKKSTTLVVKTSPSKAGMKAAYADSASKKIIKVSVSGSKVVVKGLKKGTAKIKITSGGSVKTFKVVVK